MTPPIHMWKLVPSSCIEITQEQRLISARNRPERNTKLLIGLVLEMTFLCYCRSVWWEYGCVTAISKFDAKSHETFAQRDKSFGLISKQSCANCKTHYVDPRGIRWEIPQKNVYCFSTSSSEPSSTYLTSLRDVMSISYLLSSATMSAVRFCLCRLLSKSSSDVPSANLWFYFVYLVSTAVGDAVTGEVTRSGEAKQIMFGLPFLDISYNMERGRTVLNLLTWLLIK